METRKYGTWSSPITADMVVAGTVGLGNICLDGRDLYWVEGRPEEGGRNVVVRWDNGKHVDITPAPFNARTRVHEYGGGAFTVAAGVVYFTNFSDQRIYRQPAADAAPEPLTAAGTRFADLHVTDHGLVAIGERHRDKAEPENFLALIDLETGDVRTLASGHDFYASPAISPGGERIAWLTWDHPNMPWDGTELWTAALSRDGTTTPEKVAGGAEISVFQPQWSPDGELHYVADNSGWWNLYRLGRDGPECELPRAAEFGLPQWVFRMSTWAFAEDDILCTCTAAGNSTITLISAETGTCTDLNLPYTGYSQIRACDKFGVFVAASATEPAAIVKLDLATYEIEVLRRSADPKVTPEYVSAARPLSFPSADGRTAHAYYYAPKNADFQAPPDTVPPLIVKSHGGPTAATSGAFKLKTQYWTSRGFAVLDVNYGGSTGYGRAYRQLLRGRWGIVDVDDCCAGAEYLVRQGLADPERLAITGGSAGGFTTMAALAFRDVFKAGASYYGVSDLEALARDTHKFESRYLDSVVGPYPERRDLYVERSPIHATDRLSCPIIFFQGAEDKIVPPNQAEMMVASLQKKGIHVEYVLYDGEQHGFRKSENIVDALKQELAFYRKVFDLQ